MSRFTVKSSPSSEITVEGFSSAPALVCTRKLQIGITRKIGRRQERLYQEIDALRTYTLQKKQTNKKNQDVYF